ncbi:MAG: ABC transporter permease [bacterium]
MKLFDILKNSFKALKSQKTRTVLTILGISIGIAIVITIMSAGKGLDKFLLSQMEIFGSDTVWTEVKVPSVKKTSNENAMGQATGITITTMKNKDIDTIRQHSNISAAYGWVMGQESVNYQGQSRRMLIMGNGFQMPLVEKYEIDEGRFFTEDEESSLSQVAVLGSTGKQKLFGDDSAIGKTIYIKHKPFKVIGVAKERGSAFFMDMDDIITVPAKTVQKILLGTDYVSAIGAKIIDSKKMVSTVKDIEYQIRQNHGITDPDKDDFAVSTMEEARDMLASIVDGVTFLLVALVCISLVVGGVGIMNIMYVSVTERTFEIGLRKSLGARKKDISRQFLSEAVMLTLGGGVFGILLGASLSFLVCVAARYYDLEWVYIVPISSIVLAVLFSVAVGLFFGLYPAKKAANLNPIEALRRE